MPGVPPDTIAQVKKGLRGLFSRRKSKQYESPEPQVTAPSVAVISKRDTENVSPKPNTAIAASVIMGAKNADIGAVSAPEQSKDVSSAYQIAEPSQISEAGNIKLDQPHAPIDKDTQGAKSAQSVNVQLPQDSQKQAKSTAVGSTAVSIDEKHSIAPQSTSKPFVVEDENGMSATSGPLCDHHLAEEFGLADKSEEQDPSSTTKEARELVEDDRVGEETTPSEEAIPKPKVGQYGS